MSLNNKQIINKIIADALLCNINEVQPDKYLVKDLLADSIMFIDMVVGINNRFNITITETDLEKLNKVSDVYLVLNNYALEIKSQ